MHRPSQRTTLRSMRAIVLIVALLAALASTTASAAEQLGVAPAAATRTAHPLQIRARSSSASNSVLHGLRIDGLEQIASSSSATNVLCALDVSVWEPQEDGSAEGWSWQHRRWITNETEIIRLQPHAAPRSSVSSDQKQTFGATSPAGQLETQQEQRDNTEHRWLLQLQCLSISRAESGPTHTLQVHPRNGIVAQSCDGEVVHHFTVQPLAAPSKPIRTRSWLHRAWRRWAAPTLLRLRYTIEEAVVRASEWSPIQEWLRLCSFAFTLLSDAALNMHGRCSGWLREVLRHSAFVAIFNAWRTAWIEVRRVLQIVKGALSLGSLPSPPWPLLSFLSQLAFFHLVVVLFLMLRQQPRGKPPRRRLPFAAQNQESKSSAEAERTRNNSSQSPPGLRAVFEPAPPLPELPATVPQPAASVLSLPPPPTLTPRVEEISGAPPNVPRSEQGAEATLARPSPRLPAVIAARRPLRRIQTSPLPTRMELDRLWFSQCCATQ